jgi:hypothetical protein
MLACASVRECPPRLLLPVRPRCFRWDQAEDELSAIWLPLCFLVHQQCESRSVARFDPVDLAGDRFEVLERVVRVQHLVRNVFEESSGHHDEADQRRLERV